MTEQLGLRADVGAMYGKMPKKKKKGVGFSDFYL
jgi:hypothetical protein